MEILMVKWLDARKSDETEMLGDFQKEKTVRLWSVGWGVERDNAVVLAQDFYPLEEGEEPGDECFRQILVIPRGCIIEVIRVGAFK